jgi:hypothetical protein
LKLRGTIFLKTKKIGFFFIFFSPLPCPSPQERGEVGEEQRVGRGKRVNG